MLIKFIDKYFNFLNYIVFFSIFAFIFLWDIQFHSDVYNIKLIPNFFQIRYLLILILFASFIFDFKNSIKYFYISLIVFFIFFLHQYINILFENYNSTYQYILWQNKYLIMSYPTQHQALYDNLFGFTFHNFLSLIGVTILFFISSKYYLFFQKSYYKFCLYFILINILLFLFSLLYFLVNQLNVIIETGMSLCRLSFQFKSVFLTFQENSHLGMILPPIIIFLLYNFSINRNLINILLLILSIIYGLMFYSATLLVGLLISLILVNISLLVKFQKFFFIISFVFFILILILLKNNIYCNDRIFFINDNDNWILESDIDSNIITKTSIKETSFNYNNPLLKPSSSIKDIYLRNELSTIPTIGTNINESNFLAINNNLNQFNDANIIDSDNNDNLPNIIINNDIENKIKPIEDENLQINLISNNIDENNIYINFNTIDELFKINEYKKLYRLKQKKITPTLLKIQNKLSSLRRYINTSSNNLTTSVHLNSFNLAIVSILDRPFGWGLNRFEYAFKYYQPNIYTPFYEVRYLNYNDGATNFSKIIVEFGIFSIMLFIFLIYWSFSSKIQNISKVFLIPFVATQFIRGAGYFNGGFLLIVFFMIFLLYNNSKINNND